MTQQRDLVRRRAGGRCEYCRLPEEFAPVPFQIEHIISQYHGGGSSNDNLAFACIDCNRYKSVNIAGIDPKTRRISRLFNPRTDSWARHFEWNGPVLNGRTVIGRATVQTLQINERWRVEYRRQLMNEGVFSEKAE